MAVIAPTKINTALTAITGDGEEDSSAVIAIVIASDSTERLLSLGLTCENRGK